MASPVGNVVRSKPPGEVAGLTAGPAAVVSGPLPFAEVEEAERAVEEQRYRDAVRALAGLRVPAAAEPRLALRALLAESWARMYLGELDAAVALLERARGLAETECFTDVDRADVLFRLGCCRLKLNAVSAAVSLFSVALALADRTHLPCDRLRARILEWRARCYQRQRDWEAARADVERALELAEGLGDGRTVAHVYFQASLVAERTGQFLVARCYAEQAKVLYERADDRVSVGRLLNNLGGLTFLLGDPAGAVAYLEEAVRVSLAAASEADAAQAISSLAQVHLRTGEPELAEQAARRALAVLDGRADYVDEIGNARLVLGRALLELGRLEEAERWLAAAEAAFGELGSASHQAAAWTAQGDLARAAGDLERAAALYRRAAEALQDFHF